MVLTFVVDLGNPWLTAAVAVVLAAAHSVLAQRALLPTVVARRRGAAVRLHHRRLPAIAPAYLSALAAVTVAIGALAARAGVLYPVTVAGLLVGIALAWGGPRLEELVRRIL